MKTGLQASLLVLATILSPGAFANPVPQDDGVIDGKSAPHSKSGAAVVNPGHTVNDNERITAAAAQKCFTFTSDNPNWHYANTGPWGTATGTFGSGSKKICVPHNDNAGGAMFIGSTPNPSAGNTKLECYFPSAGTANCDVSLVDGYSLSVTCKVKNTPTIGGPTNLWKTGQKCYDESLLGKGICKNARGGSATAQSQITEFFQQGVKHGNQYCIWWKCSQDYFFDVSADISCHVSGGR